MDQRERKPRLDPLTKARAICGMYSFAFRSATNNARKFLAQDMRWGDKLTCKSEYTANFKVIEKREV